MTGEQQAQQDLTDERITQYLRPWLCNETDDRADLIKCVRAMLSDASPAPKAGAGTVTKWNVVQDPLTLRRVGKTCEELGELVAVLGRTIIQGLDGIDPSSGDSNITRLTKESADVLAQIECTTAAFRLDREAMAKRSSMKQGLMAEWEALYTPPAPETIVAAAGMAGATEC